MIILLRKRSVRWLVILLVAAVIFGTAISWEKKPATESKPTIAVLAAQKPPAEEEPPEVLLTETEDAQTSAETDAIDETQESEENMPQTTAEEAQEMVEDDEEKIIALRMERNQNRAQQQAQLEDILANGSVSEQTKAQAEEKLLALSETSAMELATETLLKTKGYTQSVVMIDGGRANVYITERLVASDYDKIGDLVQSSTKFSLEQIIIIPK